MNGPMPAGMLVHQRLDDLLASADDPHPRKTRRIEWIGQASPLDDPVIQANMLLGRYTRVQEEAIRLAAVRAIKRIDGVTERLCEADDHRAMAIFKGLSRTYHFTRLNSYICDVDFKDVDILLSSSAGKEFLDLDARDYDEPKVVRLDQDVFKLIASDLMDRDKTEVPNHMVVAQTGDREEARRIKARVKQRTANERWKITPGRV